LRGGGKLLDSRHSAGLAQAVRSRNQTVAVIALNQEDGRFFGGVFAAAQLTGFHVHALQRMSVWDLTPPPDERTGDRLWAAFLDMREQHGVYTLQA